MLFQSMDTLLDLDFLVSSHGHLVMFDIVPTRNPTTYIQSNIAILLKTTSFDGKYKIRHARNP